MLKLQALAWDFVRFSPFAIFGGVLGGLFAVALSRATADDVMWLLRGLPLIKG